MTEKLKSETPLYATIDELTDTLGDFLAEHPRFADIPASCACLVGQGAGEGINMIIDRMRKNGVSDDEIARMLAKPAEA